MQKWSINPKSDMQILKSHETLFKRVIGLKRISIIIIVDFGVLSSSTACSRDNWGWRRCLQLTRVRQWNICPNLFQDRPSRFINDIHRIYPYPAIQYLPEDCLQVHRCNLGDLAGKPQSIRWVSESQFFLRILAPSSSAGSLYYLECLSAFDLLIRSIYQDIRVVGGHEQ